MSPLDLTDRAYGLGFWIGSTFAYPLVLTPFAFLAGLLALALLLRHRSSSS